MKEFRQIWVICGVLLCLSILASGQIEVNADTPHTVRLLATRGESPDLIPIGDVRVWEDPANLYIQYAITNADWRLHSTHVYVTIRNDSFTPIGEYIEPFRLELERAHRGELEYTYEIANTRPAGTHYCVAASAEVLALQGYTSDIASLIESLPETVQGFLVWPSPDNMAYFQVTILESGFFDGFHYAWCFDIDRSRIHRWYEYHVYTAYDKLPPDIMEFPENLDLVNWLLNKEFVGKQAPSGGVYTYGDVQHAVWTLLEGRSTNYSKGPWDIERATGIIESAKAEGEGFIPGCNEKFLLILVPLNPHNILHWQSIGMVIPAAPCEPTYSIETAWALAWNVAWYSIGPGLSFSIR